MGREKKLYTREELRFAPFAYGFIALFLLIFIKNDFRLIDSQKVLIFILTARGVVTLILAGVIVSTLSPTARGWYGPLHRAAFIMVALLDPLVLLTRAEFTYYNVLPSFLIIALTYFVLPARLRLKIITTLFVSFSGLYLTYRSSSLHPAGALTIPISYLGLILIGIIHHYRYEKIRKGEQAYYRRLADDIRFKRALSDSSWAGIILVREGIVVDMNQPMEELFQTRRERIIGRDAVDLYVLDDSKGRGRLKAGGGQEVPVMLEFRNVEVGGESFHAILARDLTDEMLGSPEERNELARIAVMTENLPLSKRQKQIVAELMHGLNRRQIAEKLFITDDTVKSHISQIYRKLEVQSRVELARKVLER